MRKDVENCSQRVHDREDLTASVHTIRRSGKTIQSHELEGDMDGYQALERRELIVVKTDRSSSKKR